MTGFITRRVADFTDATLVTAAADPESPEPVREAASAELLRRAGLIPEATGTVGAKPKAFFRPLLRDLDPDEREDVIATVAMKLHRAVLRRGGFNPNKRDNALERFTSTVLKRTVIDNARKRKKEKGRMDDDPETLERTGRALDGATVDDVEDRCIRTLDAPALRARMETVLAALSDRDRAILKAWSSSDPEAMKRLQPKLSMNPGALRVALHRAKKRIASEYLNTFGHDDDHNTTLRQPRAA
jgi:RNA polymerase sigma factor (sigma-70 family)